MILADKIINYRKKNGWSQEELAEMLGVSRQSVSKWESAQAIPDMKKILQLSEVFHVSTDYLLKDEIEESEPVLTETAEKDESTAKSVSLEEANSFLQHNRKAASTIALGVMMCIASPVFLILLGGAAETGTIAMNAAIAEAIGTAVLLVTIGIAVAMFVFTYIHGKRYEYLEETDIDTEYGVTGMVRELKGNYAETHSRRLIIGIFLCIVSAVPIFLAELVHYSNNSDFIVVVGTALLLAMCAAGVYLIVKTCITEGGFDKLLEEGDYTRVNKKAGKYDGIFWGIATAVYLAWSFYNMRWEVTWIVWPVAGVLYAVYHEIIVSIVKSRR